MKSHRNQAKSGKSSGIRRTLFSDAMFQAIFALLRRVYALKRSGEREREREEKKKSPDFVGITVKGILGKKFESAYIERN
jgi:hypothetical protein